VCNTWTNLKNVLWISSIVLGIILTQDEILGGSFSVIGSSNTFYYLIGMGDNVTQFILNVILMLSAEKSNSVEKKMVY